MVRILGLTALAATLAACGPSGLPLTGPITAVAQATPASGADATGPGSPDQLQGASGPPAASLPALVPSPTLARPSDRATAPAPTPAPRPTRQPPPTPSPTPPPTATLRTSMNVPYTPTIACSADGSVECQLDMDIVRPSGGGPWPVFLLLQGGPSDVNQSDYMLPLADALAHQGAVVMVADWRQAADTGGGFPKSFQDVACAVGVTRAIAGAFGGDSATVTLVGHSLGGWAGAVVTLAPTRFTPPAGTCDAVAGRLLPDAFVDLDGAVDEPTAMEDGGPYVTAFFGGTGAQQPAAYAAADPFSIVAAHPAGGSPPPILVVQATADATVPLATSQSFHGALLRAGYPNQLLLISGGHTAAIGSSTVTMAIMELGGS